MLTIEVTNGGDGINTDHAVWADARLIKTQNPDGLTVTGTPYFGPNYQVGLSARWDPHPEAVKYQVTHFRQDACDSATVMVTTTGTSSGSGRHPNCGAPESCYFKQATVEALDVVVAVIVSGSASLCEVGVP